MKQPKAPCLHCSIREPACQSSCLVYSQYIEEYKKYKELVDKARGRDKRMDNFKHERVTYSKKMAGR